MVPPYMVFYSLTLALFHGYSSCDLCLASVRPRAILREEAVGGIRLVNRIGDNRFFDSLFRLLGDWVRHPEPGMSEAVPFAASASFWSFPAASPAVHLLGKARIRRFA